MKSIWLVGIAVVAVVAAIPFVAPLFFPRELTFEKIEAGMVNDGFSVANQATVAKPEAGAVAQRNMTINGAPVTVYRFDDEQKIEAHRKRLKPRLGEEAVARNESYLIAVSTYDLSLARRICYVFKTL